jgi:hypothetical protein
MQDTGMPCLMLVLFNPGSDLSESRHTDNIMTFYNKAGKQTDEEVEQ